MNNLGVLYYQTGKYDESLQLLQEVYDVQSDFLGETHRAFLTTMHNLAKARARVGDIDGALQLWNRLNELLPEVRGPRRRDIVMYLVYVPMILNELDRHEQAEPMFERALEAHRELGGELQLQMFYTMNGLAECRMRRQRFDEAAELFLEASAGRPPGSRSAGQMADRARGRAGFCYMQLGRYPEAENHLLAAAEFLSDPSVDDPELLLETQQWLIDLYTAWHEAQPDQGYDARAAEWRAKLEQASEAQDQENEPAPSGNP
jgi:tetratricopeptide (TPR) repeat protein